MDFGLTEQQESLRSTVSELLAREWPESLLMAAQYDENPLPQSAWHSLSAKGLLGLTVPQLYGGTGHGFAELAVVIEEMGRSLLPGPFLSTSVCALAILDSGTDEQKTDLLPAIASGELTMAPAVYEPGGSFGAEGVRLRAEPSAGGYALNGVKTLVPARADRLIVVATASESGGHSDGLSLFVVDAHSPGVAVTRLPVLGIDRFCEVEFRNVQAPTHTLLGLADCGGPLVNRMMAWEGIGRCAELVGGAQAALDMTVEYVKERHAFGRPVGSFQAIQHHCANMLADVESARHLTQQAAWLVSNGRHDAPQVSMAQAWTAEAARRVTATAHQCHGAIGFTTELSLHLYHKRAIAGEMLLGGAAYYHERHRGVVGMSPCFVYNVLNHIYSRRGAPYMQYRRMGSSGLHVSVVGLGTNNFGFRMDEESSIRVFRHAVDEGINFIDTADSYGNGLSEERIGLALKGNRHDVIIASKAGNPVGEGPNRRGASRNHIMNQVEVSLRFLQTDYIDLYQIHRPDPNTPIEETMRALDDLVRQGKVRYLGCSNFAAWQVSEANWLARANSLNQFVTVQPEYNMLNRSVERELVPFCHEYNIGILPFYPLASGFLTGKYRQGEALPEGARLTGNERRPGQHPDGEELRHAWQAGDLRRGEGPSDGGVGDCVASGQLRGLLRDCGRNEERAGDRKRQGRRLGADAGGHDGDRRYPPQRRLVWR